ncbi:hypothetical protein QQ045_014511 [Rhodiola kirilowii]
MDDAELRRDIAAPRSMINSNGDDERTGVEYIGFGWWSECHRKERDYEKKGMYKGEQSLFEYQCSVGFMLDTADTFHPLMLFVELMSHDAPVIIFGGSYAGNLAAWMRLKYPHLVLVALASSAPLLLFDGVTPEDGYVKVLSRDFKEISENCYKSIKKSWDKIDEVALEENGLSALSTQFHTCS